ncbi:MAG: UbiA prenyltransferase family protein [Candidatus Roizmanbacteria bacterium]|nr:UbiA prenyltransferase family protein [Candidatus Roizmanbacteria bacterium]
MKKVTAVIQLIRVNQWIKNFSLFAAIIFTGELFNPVRFTETTAGFLVFCALSSASYVFNDLVDAHLDRRHPQKKKRPLASGIISKPEGLIICTLLLLLGLLSAYLLSFSFFVISLVFVVIHVSYTLWLKQHALFDILLIAGSFMIRVFAGEVLTGLHIPIWLTFSVIFLSLFIASCKRRSELRNTGDKTRPALEHYRIQLLDFYNSTFATGTIIAYAMFTFIPEPERFTPLLNEFLEFTFPALIGRKWLMVTTLPLIIVGIMRYAQLIYERTTVGEAPERIVTSDKTLIITLALWGTMVILFTNVLVE